MAWNRTALSVACALAMGSAAHALPIELKDQNGTTYHVNTQVTPLLQLSEASGALTNATYVEPVTVTSTVVGFSTFFGFSTVYTVQRQVNVPLRNAFSGFNGLAIVGFNGQKLPAPVIYNPAAALAGQDCPMNGKDRELVFATQTLPQLNLQVTRMVFVPDNAAFVRWLNIVTNTGSAATQVGIGLRGLLGSGSQTKIVATSSGDSTLTAGDLWFTTAQAVAKGTPSDQPRLGFVVQGAGASVPAHSASINSLGQAVLVYAPTIPAGGTAIVMTFVTVQGNNKDAKKTVEDVATLPSTALNCLSEAELKEIVNFAPITPPQLKSATVTLNFKKAAADTVQWKGKIAIGAGISLQGLPVSVDVGGATQVFLLNKSGKGNDGGGNKFSLNATLKNGVTKQGTVGFSFQLKGDFKSLFAPYGMVDATVQNVPVSLPVTFTAGPGVYGAAQAFTYKAKAGKSGTGKT